MLSALAAIEKTQLQHAAIEGATYGAASDAVDPCADAMTAAAAVLGAPVASGSTCAMEAGPPATVRVTLIGSEWSIPFGPTFTVDASAASIIIEEETP